MSKQQRPILDTALAMLARREHSTLEMRRKLAQKGYGKDEVEQTLAALAEKNYLNDARYAESRARSRAQHSKWGASRIRQELALNGVNAETAATVMEELDENTNWLATAQTLLQRRFQQPLTQQDEPADPSLGRAEAYKAYQQEKARRIAFLTRRGFSLAQALKALNLAEEGA